MDINRKAKKDVPLWSETRWAGCYNPDEGVGLFLHAGRLRGNLDWWWAQTAIYLPNGRIAVERSWVKNPNEIGVKTASLEHRVEKDGWSARFDGIVQLTTTQALGEAPRGAAAPVAAATFEVRADTSRPLWDMYANPLAEQDFADMHVEQLGRCTGVLQVGSEHFRLDGVTYYDHSCGVRDWTHFHSHNFAGIVMPDYTIHTIGIYGSETGGAREPLGVWFNKNGEPLKLIQSQMPRVTDVFGAPHEFDLVLRHEGGNAQRFHVAVLHSFPCTITFDNDNINGVDWDAAGDPMFLTECQVRVTAPDGAIGYGHVERSNRRSALLNPSIKAKG